MSFPSIPRGYGLPQRPRPILMLIPSVSSSCKSSRWSSLASAAGRRRVARLPPLPIRVAAGDTRCRLERVVRPVPGPARSSSAIVVVRHCRVRAAPRLALVAVP